MSTRRLLFLVPALVLAVFSFTNLFLSFTPRAVQGERLAESFRQSLSLPPVQCRMAQSAMLEEQAILLGEAPADPYGWARLSYLRYAVHGDRISSFAALRMSAFVSPHEPRQLRERALMWRALQ